MIQDDSPQDKELESPEQFSYNEIASYPNHNGIKELLDLAEQAAKNFIDIKKKIDEEGFFDHPEDYSNYDNVGNVVGELAVALQLLVVTDIVESDFLDTRMTASCMKLLNDKSGVKHQKPEVKEVIKELLICGE